MDKRVDRTPVVFLDFDGTISRRDVVDVILEAYADPGWLEIEDQWKAGRIGSRECLRRQMSLVCATEQQLGALLEGIELDPGLGLLLETCRRHELQVHIVSDGFDYCAARLLARGGGEIVRLLRRSHICASHLEPDGTERWRTGFPYFPDLCVHGCATCKPAAMRALTPPDTLSIFVGDGLSDRYASAAADVVFAKHSLAAYCVEKDIAHLPYNDLADVAMCLDRALWRATSVASEPLWIRE